MSQRRDARKTKLVATIGPACDSLETIKAMIRAGMNVARLNFSHGTHEEHRKRLETIRQASQELSANVATMLDTKGVEIRTGRIEAGVANLTTGDRFELRSDDRLGDAHGVSVSYPELFRELEPGSLVLIDDGVIELRVLDIDDGTIRCEITRGGRLKDRKGVNVPGTSLGLSAVNPENRADLLFAIENDVEYVAASFVRNGNDLREIRHLMEEHGCSIPVIAKIESAEGVRHLDEIIALSDGVMVARGDLGVEIPLREVPMIQKKIIRATVMNGKPVITATQMLDSMVRNPVPTRAEVGDIANAIFDGTSAVMLSAETAAGSYPVEAVRTMATIAFEAEASLADFGYLQHILPEPSNVVTEAVSQAAITMAHHLDAAAILCLTESGFTARSISKHRPRCPILGVTVCPDVVRRLAMNWGITGLLYGGDRCDDQMVEFGIRCAHDLGYAEHGDVVIVTAGVTREAGSTNMIRVLTVR